MFYLFWIGSFLDNTNAEKDHIDSSKRLFNALNRLSCAFNIAFDRS